MAEPYFVLKVSEDAFDFDSSKLKTNVLFQESNLVLVSSSNDYVKISQAGETLTLLIGDRELKHAEITWNKQRQILNVQLDALGLKNIFYHTDGKTLLLSDSLRIIQRSLPGKAINQRAALFFLIAGFLPPRWNLWNDLHQVDFQSSFDLAAKKNRHTVTFWNNRFLSDHKVSADAILDSLQSSLHLFKNKIRPTEIRLSGGVDTRLVSFLWKEPLDAVVVKSPWVTDEQDLDVNLSRAWAARLGFPHRVLTPEMDRFAFFLDGPKVPSLTGLCGGEFLGGQFVNEIPSHPRDWKIILDQFKNGELESLLDSEWITNCMTSEEFWLSESARVFVQSNKSTIYKSIEGSWSCPSYLNSSVLSPFNEEAFLRVFLSASLKKIGNYDLYQQVFNSLGSEMAQVPLNSQFTTRATELRADPSWGVDPKSVRPKPPDGELQTFADLFNFLTNSGILSSPELFSYLVKYKRLNVLAFWSWAKARFATSEFVSA